MTNATMPATHISAYSPSDDDWVEGTEANLITRFIYKESRLLDEARYDEWERLVENDMYYWIPLGEGDFDPDKHLSIAADNRTRLANRIKQLKTGARHSQSPASPMRRIVSNIEIFRRGADEYTAFCNFVLYEHRVQSINELFAWPGRIEYRLRQRDGQARMFFKKVMLVQGAGALPSIGFII